MRATVVGMVSAATQLSESAVIEAIDRGQHNGGSSGRFWTVDPIDGTKGFLRGCARGASSVSRLNDALSFTCTASSTPSPSP